MSNTHNQHHSGEETERLPNLKEGVEIPAEDEFSLESILAEFGRGEAEPAPQEESTEIPSEADSRRVADLISTVVREESAEPSDLSSPPAASEKAEAVPASMEEVQMSAQLPPEPVQEEANLPLHKKVLRFPGKFRRETVSEKSVIPPVDEDISSPLGTPSAPEADEGIEDAAEEKSADGDSREEKPPLISVEDVMSQTVDAVLEDQEDAILDEPVPLTERLQLWATKAQRTAAALRRRIAERKRVPWQEPAEEEENEPEEDLEFAAREEKRRCKRLRRQMLLAAVPMLLAVAVTAVETWKPEWMPELWHKEVLLRCGVMGGVLLLTALCAMEVWHTGWKDLRSGKFHCEAAAAVPLLAVLGDCIYCAVTGQTLHLPLAAPAAVLIWLCLVGQLLTASMRREIYRLTDLGGCPPYAVAQTAAGACKQKGKIRGFYRLSQEEDFSRRWQKPLLPLVLAACTLLSGVVCLSGKRTDEFFWVWSALLTSSLPFSLPLTGALPLRNLNRRLGRSGCAVAGYAGAAWAGYSRRMVIGDTDVFPPGTVSLNGLKIYGEEIGKVTSYAATVTRAAQSQLAPIFDQLLMSEGGHYETLQDLHYYEEGGVEGTIHGETVTMGSAYCMKKLHINLPRELKVKTGVFLAVDGQLIAIFAIKYQPSRNVEWALRSLRRSRIEPVLAVRGANITPGLLKRKFGVDAKVVYPDISTRLALSDLCGEKAHRAYAVLYREGLMPFAETVTGSRRCRKVVKAGTVLSLLGSLCGLLLSYYLTHAAAYQSLTGGSVLLFQLLWLLPIWLLASLIKYE